MKNPASLISLSFALSFILGTSSLAHSFEVQGVSRPFYDASLSFSVPGTIGDILIEEGDEVFEGQELIRLDSRAESARIKLIENEINADIKQRTLLSRAEQSRVDMVRYQDAKRHNAATAVEVQHSQLAYELNKLAIEEEVFRIDQLRLNLDELLAQKEKMVLKAPVSGYIEEIAVEKGMAVDRNVLALRLVSNNPLLIEFSLPIDQALAIKEGDSVDIRTENSSMVFEGEVAQIAKVAVLSNKTLKVRVKADNIHNLPAGLLLNVSFADKE